MNKINLIFSLIFVLFATHLPAKDYYVADFGAKADGITVNTRTIQRAIDYINQNGGGRLVFQVGNYVTGTIYLKSNVTLHLEPGATILGSTNPLDYVIDPKVKWSSMIFAINQENIGITGKGTINGRGFTTANNLVSLIHRGVFEDELPRFAPRISISGSVSTSPSPASPFVTRQAGTRHMTSARMYMWMASTWTAKPTGTTTGSISWIVTG